ncbi:hypothetical protein Pcinc_025090 [Petrolisthes cinctipes]|uniref:Uncharacterized protein n=1 Tax=Petrolisthes cinctipes TaxID=88211 RepID=A0AAE1FBB7_PETCI|nr:hypothetical protein Pcinc_025090 [Petrolisthes cinctipes]
MEGKNWKKEGKKWKKEGKKWEKEGENSEKRSGKRREISGRREIRKEVREEKWGKEGEKWEKEGEIKWDWLDEGKGKGRRNIKKGKITGIEAGENSQKCEEEGGG